MAPSRGLSDDEFGSFDDEDLLLAIAAPALPAGNFESCPRPLKRQRISPPSGESASFNDENIPPTTAGIAQSAATDKGAPLSLSTARPTTSNASSAQSSRNTSLGGGQRHVVARSNSFRQTTLLGNGVSYCPQQQKPTASKASKHEPPTHHKLDTEATKTWIYPTNLGATRDYQYNITSRALFHNLLVALPTGLGKTFIAATVMLNYLRWTKDAQIVFVAPTKPLVSQQVQACFNIAGIPRSQTSLLTGSSAPALRAEEWLTKRVFFMTPQTIMNDLKRGICDPKRIVLVVFDEAHRATGNYAYVEMVRFVRRFNESFRILALTATPGADVEAVQKVIDGLDISRVEIRTETSLDIRDYVYHRRVDKVVFEYSDDMDMCMQLFSSAVQPLLTKLTSHNAYWNRDPLAMSPYAMTQARQKWNTSDAGRNANFGIKAMMNNIFAVLASLAHSMDLLKYHGIRPFYNHLQSFRNDSGGAGAKYRKQIAESESFRKLTNRLDAWATNRDFVGHPKLEYLQEVVLNYFMDAGEGREGGAPSETRIMIFAHFRDSAEDIVRVLKRSEPLVRPHAFVGQAAAKNSEGMDQKRQQEIVSQFKAGKFNTLVATSIGEEGLDIGEVDLIICYDSKASPIRMLQRMGRTGRKRAGRIILLQMKGKEENDANKAKENYERIQELIMNGSKFDLHEERAKRILPHDVQPEVDKKIIDIPPENSQTELPEPKRKGRLPKMPKKKFHMPNNARTGFVKASRMRGSGDLVDSDDSDDDDGRNGTRELQVEHESIPTLDEVALTPQQERDLDSRFQTVLDEDEVVTGPRLDKFPIAQRLLRKTVHVRHSSRSQSLVDMTRRMRSIDEYAVEELNENLHMSDLEGEDTDSDAEAVAADLPRRPQGSETDDEDILFAEPPPLPAQNRPQSRPRTQSRPQPTPRHYNNTTIRHDDHFPVTTTHAIEAPPSSSPPPISSNMLLPTQGVDLGSADTSGADDDDQDPSSELAAFVAGDDEVLETFSSSFPLAMASGGAATNTSGWSEPGRSGGGAAKKRARKSRRGVAVDDLFTSTDDDDEEEELPSLSQIVRPSGRRGSGSEVRAAAVVASSSSGLLARPMVRAHNGRVVVMDSEDEE